MSKFETSNNLPLYFKSIDALAKPLTKAAEKELATRIQAGDEAAIHSLVNANLKFVVTIANKFIGLGLSIDDLIMEGNVGLLEAARRFTPDKDVKFITYAQFWIRKCINNALGEYGRTVRIPMNQEYDIYKRRVAGENINLSNIQIDKPIGDDDGHTLGDLVLRAAFECPFDEIDQHSLVTSILNKLNDKDRKVIETYYGIGSDEGLSAKDVAEELGMEVKKVNQTLKLARHKMRKLVEAVK
jgi:RNA polymerase primary sigma factor